MSNQDLVPIGYWNFTKRSTFRPNSPNWQPTTLQGASLEDGGLRVAANKYAVVTGYTGGAVTEKTLVAWVRLGNLDVRGGSALSLDSKSVDLFDGLVYGERVKREWMTGSNGYSRTGGVDADFATEDVAGHLVQVAAVYRNTSSGSEIVAYRNGGQFSRTTYRTALPTWQPGDIQVFFGKRHHVPTSNCFLDGLIVAAAIYDVALSDGSVPALKLV